MHGLCIVLCIGLNIGMAPFRKPGLDVLVLDTVRQRRPSFAADPCEALREAEIACIAANTLGLGGADIRQVLAAATVPVRQVTAGYIMVNKSAAPAGAVEAIRRLAGPGASGLGDMSRRPLACVWLTLP